MKIFCTFEQAVLLKEKGLPQDITHRVYAKYPDFYDEDIREYDNVTMKERVQPSHSQSPKWYARVTAHELMEVMKGKISKIYLDGPGHWCVQFSAAGEYEHVRYGMDLITVLVKAYCKINEERMD
jgi:hypothetical protein